MQAQGAPEPLPCLGRLTKLEVRKRRRVSRLDLFVDAGSDSAYAQSCDGVGEGSNGALEDWHQEEARPGPPPGPYRTKMPDVEDETLQTFFENPDTQQMPDDHGMPFQNLLQDPDPVVKSSSSETILTSRTQVSPESRRDMPDTFPEPHGT